MTQLESAALEQAIQDLDGILPLDPAWVARDWLGPGRRLGLDEEAYDLGERGFICERWLGSTTRADNRIGPDDEGLSYVDLGQGRRVTLGELVERCPRRILGETYASGHSGLGRLAKIFDYADRIPYHVHPPAHMAALVGRNPKDEAYYFPPGVDMGPHPESFFGVHPWIGESDAYDQLLPYLESWDSDRILTFARGYVQIPGEGFHIPSGVLHAPGTALTIELQEDSDVFAMLQARVGMTRISKELLFKDVSREDRERYGERFVLGFLDRELNSDPYFYENRHTPAVPTSGDRPAGVDEAWIYYNSTKFNGKRLRLAPGSRFSTAERGVYNVFVWAGSGRIGGRPVEAKPGHDELLIVHDAATNGVEIENTGDGTLEILKFFGPDINFDVPMIDFRGHGAQAPGGSST